MEIVDNKKAIDVVTKSLQAKGLPIPRSLVYYIVRTVEFFIAKTLNEEKAFIRFHNIGTSVKFIVPNWRKKIRNGEVKIKTKDLRSKR